MGDRGRWTIRLAFLIESEHTASAYYRVLANVRAFERAGVDVYPMMIPTKASQRRRMFADMDHFDVVVLQRRLLQPWEFARLRKHARVLGYDFDDALAFRDRPGLLGHRSLARWVKFGAIVRGVDFVTAGNEYLADLTGLDRESVTVIPTPVDTGLYQPRARQAGPVRLGWVGSRSTVGYLEGIMPQVERVVASHPGVTLTVVSNAFPAPRPFIRNVEWTREAEPAEVAGFDVGLMPLPDTPWTRGKCGFKLLLYGACGVPSVASPVGVNRDVIVDGETGMLAAGPEQWAGALAALVEDAALRERFGRAARRRVEANYSVDVVVPRWAAALKVAAGGKP